MSRLLLAAAAFTAALAGPVAAEPQTPLQTSFDSAVVEAGFVARDPVARFTASGEYAGISDPDFPILVANAQNQAIGHHYYHLQLVKWLWSLPTN